MEGKAALANFRKKAQAPLGYDAFTFAYAA